VSVSVLCPFESSGEKYIIEKNKINKCLECIYTICIY